MKAAEAITRLAEWTLEKLPIRLFYPTMILLAAMVLIQIGNLKGRQLERAEFSRELSQIRQKTVIKMVVTAYSNDPISINVPEWRDGFTASMTEARRGVCAADWSIVPQGTRIYVPGYGDCVVEDKGGAIKGQRLDLFFPSRGEALEWGVKRINVIVG